MTSLTLVCPACQTPFPADAGLTDPAARRAIQAAFGLCPPELGVPLVRYLGLFSPPRRALRLDKLARLVLELVELLRAGTVTRHRDTRPAPMAAWGRGLEEVLKAHEAGSLTLPLTGHGLLCEIVHRQAGQARAQDEASRKPLHPSHRPVDAGSWAPGLPAPSPDPGAGQPAPTSQPATRDPAARQSGLRQVGALAQALKGRLPAPQPTLNPGATPTNPRDNPHE